MCKHFFGEGGNKTSKGESSAPELKTTAGQRRQLNEKNVRRPSQPENTTPPVSYCWNVLTETGNFGTWSCYKVNCSRITANVTMSLFWVFLLLNVSDRTSRGLSAAGKCAQIMLTGMMSSHSTDPFYVLGVFFKADGSLFWPYLGRVWNLMHSSSSVWFLWGVGMKSLWGKKTDRSKGSSYLLNLIHNPEAYLKETIKQVVAASG